MNLCLRKWVYEREMIQYGVENETSEAWTYIIDLEN